MTASRRRRGFTLLEIMVVVAVIGILGALAGYNFNRLRSRNQFRGLVREVTGLITEARGTALVLSGAIADRRIVDTDGDCPAAFINGQPAGGAPIPGVAFIVNANPRLTTAVVIDRMTDGAPNAALPPPSNRLPTINIDCRTEPLGALYLDSAINYAASAPFLINNGANTLFVGFDGRGMATTLVAGAPITGRVILNGAGGESQTVLVSGGGQACIQGVNGRCASGR